ncbi:urate hydroxylase PuuD [Roseovarius salinarum]|uniref:urate hydroxylase PuuD n=1 Tax=Roseovarius salinarum TaxID=1981892 RepID=UPI000C33492A|nr:urate hydroxylase PuuD [Roseovarius salinarum]
MLDPAIIWDWLGLLLRWFHVVAGIAWIGSSFYFIALDLGLRDAPDLPAGAHGEEWQVHGGGFYHIRKYLVAPDRLPAHLTWFKWESYATWLSGMAMLAVIYWAGAELYLIAPAKADLAVWQAVALSAGVLVAGWGAYDLLCRSGLARQPGWLMALLFAGLVVLAWGLVQVFTGRAALLHLGAVTATIMSANVFLVIIPNQKRVTADLRAGRQPDPALGKAAKLRSTHNNYLTLPVLFLMLSNHYPLVFATPYNWAIAALTFPVGALIRHYFNARHAGAGNPVWTWGAAAALVLVAMWLSARPVAEADPEADTATAAPRFAAAEGFDQVTGIVQTRCAMCHARDPLWPGLRHAPRGVVLETPAQVAAQARAIYLQSGRSRAMPPANLTALAPEERRAIRDWYRAADAAPWRLAGR